MSLQDKIEDFNKNLKSGLVKTADGCLGCAQNLQKRFQGGEIWAVYWTKYGSVNHYYFIPPDAKPDDTALNQADTIFPQYPMLTVAEVMEIGSKPKFAQVL